MKKSYILGQEAKELEITATTYNAWPKGLISCGQDMARDLSIMTENVRDTAKLNLEMEKMKIPKNILSKIAYGLGYLLSSQTIVTSHCTSKGPVNPFTSQTLY